MPESKSPQPKDKGTGSNNGWILPVVLASIPVIGTILVAYFTYVVPLQLSLHSTQTAEARAAGTPTPSLSPSPTATEFVASLTPTATPTPTLPTPTMTPSVPQGSVKYCVDIAALNVRNGPGMDYDPIGALHQDDCLYFDGQFLYGESYYWVRISPNQAGFTQLAGGWVYGGALRPQDFDRLQAVTPPPLPYHTPTIGF
jgi:hypothetical protein